MRLVKIAAATVADAERVYDVQTRIDKLAQCCFTILAEFDKIARDECLGVTRILFQAR